MGAWGSWVIDGGLWPVMVVCGLVMVDCGSVRVAEENKVVEKDGERKAERMGSEAMESSAHLANLSYPPRRSHQPSADLSSPFHFFSFFLHSSPISPEFFLSFADLV